MLKAIVKKAAYEKLAAKVNNINIRAFVLKTKYQIDKTNILKLLQTKNIFNSLDYLGNKTRLKLNGSILRQHKVSYTHGKVVNIYIVDKLGASSPHSDDATIKIIYLAQSH